MSLYNCPTTFKRIVPERGCGFILKRIYDLTYDNQRGDPVTKKEVYAGSKWEGREKYGFASLLWSALLKDGLIRSVDGMAEYELYRGFRYMNGHSRSYKKLRAKGHVENGKYTVRYHITANGMGVLFDMMKRVNKTNKTLNTVCSVAEYDAENDLKELEKLAGSPPPDILQKEALDCAKLAADYAGENQKLRAEKNDTNERLKKLYGRLIVLETTIHELQDEVAALAWDK